MANKKTTNLTSDLIATKGKANPPSDMKVRAPSLNEVDDSASHIPLNFRVTADFRRRFRTFAATHDLKLNELLQLAFDDYEKRHR
jgi:hypothetical protein